MNTSAKKSPLQLYRESQTPPLTQIELAEKLGVSQSFIANIERGYRPITPKKAKEWESKIGISRARLCPDIFGDAEAAT